MEVYYLDTSAAVKRYVDEVGSDWLRTRVDPARYPLLIASQLLIVEMVSAFARRLREGSVTQVDYDQMVQSFRDDCRNQYQIVEVSDPILNLACELIERHPLRAYDAMHLATAIVIHRFLQTHHLPAVTLLCADDRLVNAATAEGLLADNPNWHP